MVWRDRLGRGQSGLPGGCIPSGLAVALWGWCAQIFTLGRSMPLLLLLLAAQPRAFAQNSFYYGAHRVEPPSNVWRFRFSTQQARQELGTPVEGKYYLVGQFRSYPTSCQQDELRGNGVELLQYMGSDAFFLTIDTAQLKQAIGQSNLVSLFPPEWRWKCDPAIADDQVPPETLREDGSMGIVVVPFPGYPLEWIQAKLLTLNIEGKHVLSQPPFNTFALWLPRDVVITLAQEGWVRYICLAGPEVRR